MENGRLIAKVLAGSWRQATAPLIISPAELDAVAPMLLESGAGALGWKRVSNSNLCSTPPALELEQAYRLHALQSVIHERDIKHILTVLQSAGVEPILVKGWAVARLYPDPGLRPYGDFDLCVDPEQYQIAKVALDRDPSQSSQVDLHQGFKTLDHSSWNELLSRSHLLNLDEAKVRVLSAEDHLRILCFHFLREGAWRPLWLCDIAVAIETRLADFDWQLFAGRNERRRKWFACAIRAAQQLLDADLEGMPESLGRVTPPVWFLPTLLKAWSTRSMLRRHRTPMKATWRAPRQALRLSALHSHWPNPIEATVGVDGPFNELPRLPFQLGNCAVRTIQFLRRARAPSR